MNVLNKKFEVNLHIKVRWILEKRRVDYLVDFLLYFANHASIKLPGWISSYE